MANVNDMLAKSADYQAMFPYWRRVEAIVAGSDAVKAMGKEFLPQFPNESDANYKYRRENAKFTNIFSDISENLSSKPFTKEVALANAADAPLIFNNIIEDIDGSGSHLNIFANNVFSSGINEAISWILVDYPTVPDKTTLADERASGARPYWLHIQAKDMLWVESAIINGKEQFVYAKIYEPRIERNSSGSEVLINRVRIFIRDKIDDGYAPARYEIWEDGSNQNWAIIEEGQMTIGVIPLVPFFTGRRFGSSWLIMPPMRNVVDLQIEHYQAETNLKNAKELAAFPMLVGSGLDQPVDNEGKPITVPVGPSTILYAPPFDSGGGSIAHGSWSFIEPTTASLQFLSSEVDKIEKQMREIGRQPLTSGSTGLTQVAASFASQKAASAVQVWAFHLKDALENAFVYTGMWLEEQFEPTVYVNSDFAIEIGEDKAPDILLTMQQNGSLSLNTLWQEMRRRNILSPEFDAEAEEEKLLAELPGGNEEDINAANLT